MSTQLADSSSGLADPRVSETLKDLHDRAKNDRWIFLRAAPAVALAALRGKKLMEVIEPRLSNAYIPVDPDQGALLYLTARATGARNIVEFGTSFGISTIYLAAAARANGGRVIGTELEPKKIIAARANVARAGLAEFVQVLEGDAMQTLAHLAEPIDCLFLDGWKDLYLPLIKMLAPKLRAGAIVLADNIFTFKKALRPYVDYMQNAANGFESVTLPLGHGMEYSLRVK